jgi:hypothetical protein
MPWILSTLFNSPISGSRREWQFGIHSRAERLCVVLVIQAGWKGDSIITQFMGQALFVGRFEQSWSEATVYFNGTADYGIRKLVEFHLRALRVLRGSTPHVVEAPRF